MTPPSRTMSTLAISMIESVAGSMPVVSMSITRIKNRLSHNSVRQCSSLAPGRWTIKGSMTSQVLDMHRE